MRAAIQMASSEAEEELIAEAMGDDDNAGGGHLGAAHAIEHPSDTPWTRSAAMSAGSSGTDSFVLLRRAPVLRRLSVSPNGAPSTIRGEAAEW
ncbi:hypothetical protein [Protofrankia coriariae]|uniref:Uncharacterized protein n=1 Tax=Protofrankia coriariae TaxID=1562887 RepID=A0ABR5F0P8_9ACTN|nr:hypothetical protein [Protofrankia coriariae]KLL10284.1 hypothetical protein FrCorBMG51_19085 [Protofrankia coriariae]ONH32722.1 hypothetical protein BL254_21100 [Protofrankia sp. BMG5.30]